MAHIPNLGKPQPAPPVVITGTNGLQYFLPQAAVTLIPQPIMQQIADMVVGALISRLASAYGLNLVPQQNQPTAEIGDAAPSSDHAKDAPHAPSSDTSAS